MPLHAYTVEVNTEMQIQGNTNGTNSPYRGL